jgi:hypothetical protein
MLENSLQMRLARLVAGVIQQLSGLPHTSPIVLNP